MRATYTAGPDIHVLPSDLPIPGAGLQPVNAYLIRSTEPILVDAGMPVDRAAFQDALWSLVDPADLRWVVITHDDRDHTGSLPAILDAAPHARVITNGVSLIRLSEEYAIPSQRVVQVNPGQRYVAGDRTLGFLRPPVFDSPGTIGVFDTGSRTLFSSDSFGTVLPDPVEYYADTSEAAFLDGFGLLNRAIAPWVTNTDPARFAQTVRELRALDPERLLSSHGPVVTDRVPVLLDAMAELPRLPAWLPASDLDVDAALAAHDALAG
jgi:flavorubredoxin